MTSVVPTQVYGHAAANVADTAHADGQADALFVGNTGDVVLELPDGTELLFENIANGAILPVRHVRVEATGTTGTGLIALYFRKPR